MQTRGGAMRTFILILLLAFVSSNAIAEEWVQVAEDAIDIIYVNPSTIRKNGHMVKMWELQSDAPEVIPGLDDAVRAAYPNAFRNKPKSIKMQVEYDCKEEQARTLFVYEYTGNMGTGEIIPNSIDTGKWEPVVPESVGQSLWKYACGKK
jgi:hypothetical protein